MTRRTFLTKAVIPTGISLIASDDLIASLEPTKNPDECKYYGGVPETVAISFKSQMTTECLIKNPDGSIELNVYGELACFITSVLMIDRTTKLVGSVRVESQPFNLHPYTVNGITEKIKIKQRWIAFDHLVRQKADKFLVDNPNFLVGTSLTTHRSSLDIITVEEMDSWIATHQS